MSGAGLSQPPVSVPVLATSEATRPSTVPGAGPVLVARDDELALIVAALREGRSALVVGEAGTGKTALVNEALTVLRSETTGTRVVTVHANSADQVNLSQALRPLLRQLPPDGDGDLSAALRTAAQGQQLILRIEDAHLLDDPSRSQVGWLAREGEFTVVATLRRAAGSQWPWLDLWKNACVERIDVEVFGQAEVQDYLETNLDGAVSVAVGWRLWKATGGVPERVVTVVHDERLRDRLRQIDGVWHWIGMAEPDRRLLAVVEHDLAALTAQARSTLELVAVLGPAPYGLVYDLAPEGALKVLQHRGLVTTSLATAGNHRGELMVNLMHPSYAETVRLNLSRERSIQLFEYVDHLLDDSDLPPDLHVSLVAFALRSGVTVPIPAIRRALGHVYRTSLGEAAVSIIDDAIRQGVDDEYAAELLMLRALSMRRQGKVVRASRDLDQVDMIVTRLGDPPALVLQGIRARADLVHFGKDDADAALRMLASAEEWAGEAVAAGDLAPEASQEIALHHVSHALWAGLRGSHLERALAILEAGPFPVPTLWLVAPVVLTYAQSGSPDAALAIAAKYSPAMVDYVDEYPLGQVSLSVTLMLVSLWAGRYQEGPAFDPGRAGDPVGSWRHFVNGYTALTQGVWSLAETELHVYAVTLAERDPLGLRGYVDAVHALAAAAAGDRGHARDLIDRSAASPLGRWGALESEIRLLRLDASMWVAEPDAAAQARELADWAQDRGDHRVELEALHRYCRLVVRQDAPAGAVTSVMERIRALVPNVDGRRAELLVRHAESLVRDDVQMIELHERALNQCGLWLAPVRSAPVATLTHREREIAQMAAGGMSSKAIAERLVLSVRTVDTHLARAYAKFGVHSREELSQSLRRGGSRARSRF